MRLGRFIIVFILLAFAGTAFSQVSNDNEEGVYKIQSLSKRDFVPGQVLVKFKDVTRVQVRRAQGRYASTNASGVTAVLQKYGTEDMEQLLPQATVSKHRAKAKPFNGDEIEDHDLTQLYCVKLGEEHSQDVMQLVDDLKALDEVEFAEPNYRMYIMADDHIAANYSDNPMVGEQWYLDAYGVKELWNKPMITKERPVIAIIDTGVDITHPDLKDNIWTKEGTEDEHGYDFVNNTTKMRDSNRHGTHVAGIAAAANNGVGIIGANPRALIMPVTVMQSDGTGDVATIVKGIDYAVKNGAKVLNMSIGTYANSQALRQALENAYQSAVIVAAAGNDGFCIYASHFLQHASAPCFPAAYSFVLGVQATSNASGKLASFSNYDDDGPLFSCESSMVDPDGFNYELKAPGTRILSTIPGGNYKELQGTSMASPLVAGAISALMTVKQYENQEILWGDLLHTNNIAEAYNVTARPAELDVTQIVLRDRNAETEYNEDENSYLKYYEVNVGETINIFPILRSSFGRANNIKLKVSVPAGVDVLTPIVDFGYGLDAFGKTTSKNPLVIKIPDEMPNASTINVTIEATCDESDQTASASFLLKVCNMYTLKGLITQDMTLTADHVYYVISDVGIAEGSTMTIEPGTRIEFASGTNIQTFGRLNAHGTLEKPIVFAKHNQEDDGVSNVGGHGPLGKQSFSNDIFTNSDHTLFTILPTELTPIQFSLNYNHYYYDENSDTNPSKTFWLSDYVKDWEEDLTGKEELLKDPSWLTPAVLKLLEDWNAYCTDCNSRYPTEYTGSKTSYASVSTVLKLNYYIYKRPADFLTYCIFDKVNPGNEYKYLINCLIRKDADYFWTVAKDRKYNFGNYRNLVNGAAQLYWDLSEDNYINNLTSQMYNYKFRPYSMWVYSDKPGEVNLKNPCYLGSANENVIRETLCEYGNLDDVVGNATLWGNTYATLNLDNVLKEPIKEAHGIVWKVLVNGIDPQDEYEQMLPLGVDRQKFEVYFNRPMNKAVIPQISFGPLFPYTKQQVSEDGEWNEEGTVYTAYVTIDGKTQCDGMNRIYIRGAEDNEYFPCPYEATRFNIMVQATGSMASGFQADPGLGCVNLRWNNENNDFEDAMGFNVYRYTEGEGGVNDTVRINTDILDISATTYIDDNVIPGQAYYYYYKVLSTALQEYDVSNVVTATPLTATRGDANGSGKVDVADIVTTVNYVTGQQPKPFVFDAADMNKDKLIDIFDVVGIIQGILNPSLLATASLNEDTVTYFIEDGIVYVESPVTLAGVQVQLEVTEGQSISSAEDMNGFEQASAWLSDTDYLFLAYSLNGKSLSSGKHALLYIGDAKLTSLRLSDLAGHNVTIVEKGGNAATGIDSMKRNVMAGEGVYDLLGRKVTVQDKQNMLKHGVYIINGQKVVK